MRILYSLLALLITNAHANTYQLSCLAADFKSSFVISSTKDQMIFSYKNTEGRKFFPLYSGIVTAKTVRHIKSAKLALSEIDQQLEFSWPIEECFVHDEERFLVKCLNKVNVQFPKETKLQVSSLSTSLLKEQSFGFTYEKLKVRFILTEEDKDFEISIPFSKDLCKVTYEKQN